MLLILASAGKGFSFFLENCKLERIIKLISVVLGLEEKSFKLLVIRELVFVFLLKTFFDHRAAQSLTEATVAAGFFDCVLQIRTLLVIIGLVFVFGVKILKIIMVFLFSNVCYIPFTVVVSIDWESYARMFAYNSFLC